MIKQPSLMSGDDLADQRSVTTNKHKKLMVKDQFPKKEELAVESEAKDD